MKKALVTGGAGFIGSHLVKLLVDNDWQVTVVDDLSSGDLQNLDEKLIKFRVLLPDVLAKFLETAKLDEKEILVIAGDMVDPKVVQHVRHNEYTHVFHLAANPRVEFSVKYPAASTSINVQKTIELMSLCKQIGIQRFVFASSSAVYGEAHQFPTTEEHPKEPNSPYGLQKLVVEQFMNLFSKIYELDCVALRFGNVYGPNSDGDSPYSTAIASWCKKLKDGEPLRSDGDGTQSRDMIFVEDVARGLMACAERKENFGFLAMNIGTGKSFTNNQLLDRIGSLAGVFEIQHAPVRVGDVKYTCLDITRMKHETGWEPQTTLERGLRRTLDWWGIPTVGENYE